MIKAERTAVLLLAAGLSTRFGPQDKLAEPLRDLPLGLHAARAAAALPFAARIVVTGPRPLDFPSFGFTVHINDNPAAGQAHSIILGIRQVRTFDVDAVLIMLADMPFVTKQHLAALLDSFEDTHSIVASTAEASPSPPALFGVAHFTALAGLTGDHGARRLLRQAKLISAPPHELMDIDTAGDLAACSQPDRTSGKRQE